MNTKQKDLKGSVRVMGIQEDSCVDGPGLRYVVFVQGCPHHCKGCHNQQSWGFGEGKDIPIQKLYDEAVANPMWEGVTFSGGEPFAQPEPLSRLASALHDAGKDVWCFSGYTFEQLAEMPAARPLMESIDVLVDGRFELEKRDLTLTFRGSSNQRILEMKESMEKGCPVSLTEL